MIHTLVTCYVCNLQQMKQQCVQNVLQQSLLECKEGAHDVIPSIIVKIFFLLSSYSYINIQIKCHKNKFDNRSWPYYVVGN